jgi:tRNA-(ms[2]io[6]A)-hydroxylase
LAERYASEDIAPRIALFKQKEQELIETTDELFRFHSGPLAA